MSLSYFNNDQQDYMNDLAKIKPDDRCYCGWFPKGECHTCPPHLSAADKLKVMCPECHNAPLPGETEIRTHTKGCSHENEV